MSTKREKNFTAKEETLLVSLIKDKYKNIIENKKTDSVTNKDKAVTWEKLCLDFNKCSGEEYRSAEALKSKYMNIKKRSKKKFADHRQQMYDTGGGPYQPELFDNVDSEVQELLGNRASGFLSEFDGDNQFEIIVDSEINSERDISSMETEIDSDSCENKVKRKLFQNKQINIQGAHTSDAQDNMSAIDGSKKHKPMSLDEVGQSYQNWSTYNPDSLRTPKSIELKPKRQGMTDLKTKLAAWAKKKERTEEIFSRCQENEHVEKIKRADERHKLEMKHAEEEHQQKLRLQEEEHQQKLRLQEEEHQQKLILQKETHELRIGILNLERKKLIKEINT